MHAHDHGAPAGTESPTSILQPGEDAVPKPSSTLDVVPDLLAYETLIERVFAFLQRWSNRDVSDAEVRQHAVDCTHLMEVAYARFQACGDPADREHAVLWMHGRDDALRILRDRGHTHVDMGR